MGGAGLEAIAGNIYGDPVRVSFDPRASTPIRLVADKVIPPIQPPTDSAQVKQIRIQRRDPQQVVGSPDLSRRDGAAAEGLRPASGGALPGELRARALLLRAPGNFGSGGAFDAFWAAAGTPRLIYVTLQHPTPYYDDSCGVNSDNNGPYGDAIMQELIPAVESRFRVIREPWARMLTGGSTGGWIAAAHQSCTPTSTAARSRAAPTASISGITRSSTSTATPTPTSSTKAG